RVTLPPCVASSGTHERMRYTLGLTGLYDRFAGRIFSSSEVARGKPAPDIFLYAAERMGVDPAACAVVEDSRYGVEAARAAGMLVFGFTGGLTAPATLVDRHEKPRSSRSLSMSRHFSPPGAAPAAEFGTRFVSVRARREKYRVRSRARSSPHASFDVTHRGLLAIGHDHRLKRNLRRGEGA